MLAGGFLKKINTSPLLKSVGIYSLSGFLAKGASFLLIPFFTNLAYMSTADNGLLNLFSQSVVFLMPFISLGVLQSSSTDFYKLDKKEFSNLFTTGFVMSATVAVISLIVFFLAKNYLQQTHHFPLQFLWIIPLTAFLNYCYEHILILVRNNNKPWEFLGINVSRIVLELGIAVVLIVFFSQHWQGRITGIVVANVLTGLYAFYYFFKNGYLTGGIQKKYLRQEVVYALPVILLQVSVFCMNSSDRFFLSDKNPDDKGVVGIYGIACTFASVINVFAVAYLQYVMPKIYSLLSAQKPDFIAIRKHIKYFLVVATGLLVLVMLITPLIYYWLIPPVYHPALRYFYLIVCGYYFWTISYLFYAFLLFYKQKRIISILSVINIIISLSFYYFFINKWNQAGAAWANFISYFIILIITLLFSKRYIKQLYKTVHEGVNLQSH